MVANQTDPNVTSKKLKELNKSEFQNHCGGYRIRTVDHSRTTGMLQPSTLKLICGGYRSRTDDPLRARQML